MALYRNKNTGDTFDSGKKPSRRLEHLDNWERLADPAPERAYPDGDPVEGWTVPQLTAWAADNGVQVPAGPKPTVVEAVLTALAERKAKAEADAKEPANPDAPPQE